MRKDVADSSSVTGCPVTRGRIFRLQLGKVFDADIAMAVDA
jgi:hypothetical protein